MISTSKQRQSRITHAGPKALHLVLQRLENGHVEGRLFAKKGPVWPEPVDRGRIALALAQLHAESDDHGKYWGKVTIPREKTKSLITHV
jgi:hypothetical protein